MGAIRSGKGSRRDGPLGQAESVSRQSAVCGDADRHRFCTGADHYSVWLVPGIYDDDFEQHRPFERGPAGGFSRSRIFRYRTQFFRAEILPSAFDAGSGARREGQTEETTRNMARPDETYAHI